MTNSVTGRPVTRRSLTAQFSSTVGLLAEEVRRTGLEMPGFRSPPRLPGVNRSIRRLPAGSSVVAVTLRGRSADDVVADMIEGIVACNHLEGPQAEMIRDRLYGAVSLTAAA